jgi:hypothetical protein
MMMNSEEKHPCLKRDSNPRSQRPSHQGVPLRLVGERGGAENCVEILRLKLREINHLEDSGVNMCDIMK